MNVNQDQRIPYAIFENDIPLPILDITHPLFKASIDEQGVSFELPKVSPGCIRPLKPLGFGIQGNLYVRCSLLKTKLWIPVGILLVTIIAWAFIYTYPKQLTFTMQGVMYQLGEENKDYVKPAAVSVNGKMQKSILGVKTFKGVIDIEGENIPVPEENRELELRFSEHGEAQLFYRYIKSGNFKQFLYGIIFINNDFSKIAIMKYQANPDDNGGGWNGSNGYMISAPAQNRDEALKISNELLDDFYTKFTLK